MKKTIPLAAAVTLALAWCSNESGSPVTNRGGNASPLPKTANYSDGTYRADGPFMSPIGKDGIVVDVTLANGDGTIAGMAIKPVADSLSMNAEWIERFSTDIKKVVGKKISEIESLGGVSGSTLTYQGFMIAVENIRAQASSPR